MAATTTRLPIGIEEIDGAALATVNNAGALPVEVLETPDVTLAAGQSVDVGTVTTLPDIAIASGEVVGIDPANNTIQISQTAGENGVDIVKIGGNAVAGSALPVTFSSPGAEQHDYQTATVVKDLGTQTLNFADITAATTGFLTQLSGFSQVQMQLELQAFDGTTATTVAVTGTPSGGGPFDFTPPSADYISLAGGAGVHYRVVATNLDKRKDADIHLFCAWAEI